MNNLIIFVFLSVIFSVFGFVDDAFAWHDAGQKKWGTTNNAFLCEDSLNDIKHELFVPCVEAIKAAQSWSNVRDSSWTFTYTSGDQAPIHLSGAVFEPNDDTLAVSYGKVQNDKVVGAIIKFNLDIPFTDVSNFKSNKNYYDFGSVAFHEFGHLQWLTHSQWNWDSVMDIGLSPNTIKDKPQKHDVDVLKARYPS